METYTRRERSKKQRRDQCAKALAASALLKLSEQVISTTQAPDSVNVMGDDQDNPATMTADECQNTECIELKQSFEQLSSSFDKLKVHSEMLETDCQALRNENSILKDKVKSLSLLEADFEDDDDKVKMLTGVQSFTALMTLFYIIQDHLKANSALSPFKQFILTLLRLRLNLSFTFLAYYFGVHVTTVSRIFHHCINVMYTRLVPSLVFWPDREELRLTLPYVFRRSKFNKCTCIIDCFEIFTEKPRSLLASAQSYSSYKSHQTIKYLIGITPQGVISFISNGWGGRTSDKHITENSGFLNKLEPGDLILADRGFDVGDTIGLYQAKLKIPAFTRGQKQLDPLDIENTRGLAAVRINVERVIGTVRQKFTILQSTLPTQLQDVEPGYDVTNLDKIVQVCCALTNVSESVVPFE